MIAYLLQGLSLGVSAAASPGPFQAFVIAQSLKHGWRRTLPAALAPLLTDGPIIALVLFILTSLPDGLLRVIQLVGGLFVLYLAWKSFQAYRHFQPEMVEDPTAARKSLWQAVLMNFLSPGPYLFWSLMAGPALLRGWQESPGWGLAFLFGFYFALVSGMALLIVLFSAARRLGPRANRAMLGLSAVALLAFGVVQLWEVISSQWSVASEEVIFPLSINFAAYHFPLL